MPEQPTFEAQSRLYGPKDERPDWSEGYLQVQRNGATAVALDITRSGGERIIEALHEALHPWGSSSVQAAIEDELDAVLERLITKVADDDDKGKAQGLTFALAIVQNPYAPDFPGTKRAALARAGKHRDQVVTDPQTLWLHGQGMLDLRTLADTIALKNYRKMDKAALVSALDQFDLDAYRLPQPEAPASSGASDDDVLFNSE